MERRIILTLLVFNQVCSYLGGQLENYCIEFLAEYTDDIIDMLVIQRIMGTIWRISRCEMMLMIQKVKVHLVSVFDIWISVLCYICTCDGGVEKHRFEILWSFFTQIEPSPGFSPMLTRRSEGSVYLR